MFVQETPREFPEQTLARGIGAGDSQPANLS